MIAKFLFSLFFLLSCINLQGQIYFSELLPDYTHVGPKNVNFINEAVVDHYIKLNEVFRNESIFEQNEHNGKMIALEEKIKLKRKEAKILKKLHKQYDKIQYEIDLSNDFLEMWNTYRLSSKLISDLAKAIERGKCLNIKTTTGVFVETDVEIHMEEIKFNVDIVEYFPVRSTKASTKWVKKKTDRNCLSADPNDCSVWCLVEVKPRISYTDYTGRLVNYESMRCPQNFYFSDGNKCQREINISSTEDKPLLLLLDNETNEVLTVLSYDEVNCQ